MDILWALTHNKIQSNRNYCMYNKDSAIRSNWQSNRPSYYWPLSLKLHVFWSQLHYNALLSTGHVAFPHDNSHSFRTAVCLFSMCLHGIESLISPQIVVRNPAILGYTYKYMYGWDIWDSRMFCHDWADNPTFFCNNTLVWIQMTVFLLVPDKIDNINLIHSSWNNFKKKKFKTCPGMPDKQKNSDWLPDLNCSSAELSQGWTCSCYKHMSGKRQLTLNSPQSVSLCYFTNSWKCCIWCSATTFAYCLKTRCSESQTHRPETSTTMQLPLHPTPRHRDCLAKNWFTREAAETLYFLCSFYNHITSLPAWDAPRCLLEIYWHPRWT